MAKSTSRPPKKPTPISSNVAVEDAPPDIQDAIPPDFEPLADETPAEIPAPRQEAKPAKTPTFYETINKIPKADWGPRANIYLYRVEPVIDRTRSGDTKFINTYAEPVNEDRVMADYGSGRYKLMLNFRKAGEDTGNLLDSVYMDILNMKYPPKIPLGEWTDDPRNKKWAWAKEAIGIPATPAAQPAPTGVETFVDVLRATGDIRREIREEMQDNAPPAPAVPAVDPWSAAEKILNMRSDNPMVTILMNQLTAMQTAQEAAREREFRAQEAARQREMELQKELRQQTAAPSKSLADQALELIPLFDKFEPLLKRLGIGNGAVEGAVRVAKTTGMDILHDVVTNPQIVQTLYAAAVNLPLMFGRGAPAPANGQAVSPAVLPAIQGPPAPPAPETEEERMQRIGGQVTEPMLYQFFLKGATGGMWAEQMSELWPNEFKFTQALGAEKIVNGYRNTRAWMIVGPMESEFIQFMTEFCQWKPGDEEQPDDIGITDLDQEDATS